MQLKSNGKLIYYTYQGIFLHVLYTKCGVSDVVGQAHDQHPWPLIVSSASYAQFVL